ncbi:SMP-30/gluconolactonase/LRE family protein [Aliifodinibius sp. S!AR15-10]|uniref:SMP-30/gluconolactonase/LRE family protein n=1 Tax=Aliifodinibius sp. S!AR15-10 TaxID=2950437 RepID=UPI00285F4352|nr:SMP-30/gluconolactonase/LRE family protein [Aliifodinibius sp. S!AR15-10]MDR8392576.1 SMP-30/gluconolactonase/LRE family protein [Aliifodinibius sp. S!AR15-10]
MADNAELTLVSNRFSFTEGPAADSDGNVYFTDQPNNDIWKYGIDGNLTLFMDESGRSNGMYFDHSGNLLTCADAKGEMWSISPEKEVRVLFDNFQGQRLNGPNDLWVDPKGGVYFTDPFYPRDYWERTEKDIEEERVYYLTPDREEIKIVADNLVKPNGIIGTPDGKTLYVADIGDKKTYSYSINSSDAQLSNRKLFTDIGSDGMTIDNQGNVYLTGNGVTVFDKNGKQIEHIPVPQGWTANVTFGGVNRQMLFITASTAVYTLDMKVQGR